MTGELVFGLDVAWWAVLTLAGVAAAAVAVGLNFAVWWINRAAGNARLAAGGRRLAAAGLVALPLMVALLVSYWVRAV